MKPILPYKANEHVRITSAFGYRNLNGFYEQHTGLDLVSQGQKEICAPIDGDVLVSQIITDKSNTTWEWGNYVCIRGIDGNLYYLCHMASRSVKAGQKVKQGDVIGVEGNTGYSFGSHCHFEVRKGNEKLNPAALLGIDNEAGTLWRVPTIEPDGNIPHEWAIEAVNWAKQTGILKGTTSGDLKLHDNATREDMLVFLHRALNK